MPVPTNTTAATAMDITSLPFTVTQDVADQLSTLELWYRYVGVLGDRMLGVVPYADISGDYLPKLYIYTGTASSLTIFKVNGAQQRAASIPIEEGVQYFFKVTQGGATSPLGDSLTFRAERAANGVAPAESILAAEENVLMRTPVLSSTTDNTALYFIQDIEFPTAAIGTTLPTGQMIMDGTPDGDLVTIYNGSLTRIYQEVPSYFAFGPSAYTSDADSTFYLLYSISGPAGTDRQVRTLTATGGETSDTWTLPDSYQIQSFAPSRDGTIMYYAQSAFTGTQPVKRFDLAGNAPLSDLAAHVANYVITTDMLVLEDGSIVVSYRRLAVPHAFVRRYSAAGATLNTYDFGTDQIDHMALSYATPTAFWVWIHTDPVGGINDYTRTIYRKINAADGATIVEAQYDMFTNGPSEVNYDTAGYTDADDVPIFGPAPSCTFFVLVSATSEPTVILPEFDIEEEPRRWLRRAPIMSSENRRVFYNLFELDIQTGVGLASGEPEDVDPEVMMRWSSDSGRTWSNELWRSMGKIGEYSKRLQWWRLGQGRNRVFEVSGSAKVRTVLLDGFVDIDPSDDAPKS